MIGYLYNHGGLNNQKLALFGLFLAAIRTGEPLVLPDLFVLDAVASSKARFVHPPPPDQLVPVAEVYRLDLLQDFAASHGVTILDTAPIGEHGGWHYMSAGAGLISGDTRRGKMTPQHLACDFFRHLIPHVREAPLFQALHDQVHAQCHMVAQFRIEVDWQKWAATHLARKLGTDEDYNPSFHQIAEKIKATLPERCASIYVVCDEAALPTGKDDIRRAVTDKHGITLHWKSDFAHPRELAALSPLHLSVLDFEMALAAPCFVGMTRSTFSNMVTFEAYARGGKAVESHYIYNVPGAQVARRTDNGAFDKPEMAVG